MSYQQSAIIPITGKWESRAKNVFIVTLEKKNYYSNYTGGGGQVVCALGWTAGSD